MLLFWVISVSKVYVESSFQVDVAMLAQNKLAINGKKTHSSIMPASQKLPFKKSTALSMGRKPNLPEIIPQYYNIIELQRLRPLRNTW